MLLIYVTLAWLAGIVLAEACAGKGWLPCGRADAALLAAVVAVVGALALALRRQRRAATLALLLAAFLLGGWRYSASPLQPCLGSSDLASYHQLQGQYATVEGVIDAYPDRRAFNTQYRLRVERLLLHGQSYDVRGVALVQAEYRPLYPYGARVRFQGVLETPPVLDDFDYRAYLARKGIHTLVRRAEGELLGTGEGWPLLGTLYALRERSETAFARALPQPLSGVARAMFLGSGGAVPIPVADAFRDSGTSHLLVISGSNIALLSWMLLALLRPLAARRWVLVPAAALVLGYVLLTGPGSATLRAGIMALLAALAYWVGREHYSLATLALTALVMTGLNPLVTGDVGFQLSFAATIGLIGLTSPLQKVMTGALARRFPRAAASVPVLTVCEALAVTLAAQAATLPLIIHHFGTLSLLTVPANVLLSPLQPLLLLVGTLAAFAGMFSQQVVAWLSAPLGWLLDLVVQIAIATSAAPENTIEVQRWLRTVALLPYAVVLSVWLQRRAGILWAPALFRGRQGALAGGLIVLVWGGAWYGCCRPDGLLHVRLEREGSTAALVTPGGQSVIVELGGGDGAGEAALEPGRGPWGRTVVRVRAMAVGERLSPGQEIYLRRLPGRDPRVVLEYRDFRLLLPPQLDASEAPSLLWEGADLRTDLLVAPPGAGATAWPVLDYACDPQMVIDWSPAVPAAIPGHHVVATIDPEAELEITTGGAGFSLRTRWRGEGN